MHRAFPGCLHWTITAAAIPTRIRYCSLHPGSSRWILPSSGGIDTSPDKQQILRNMVAYAHPRSMKIVAEGVETAAELRTVIELGADLLQGYFLARPAIVPGDIAPEAAGIIQELQRRKKD